MAFPSFSSAAAAAAAADSISVHSSEKIDCPGSAGRSTPGKPDSDTASETSSINSAASSERRDIDFLAQVLAIKSEEYRLLFRLPNEEVLIQDFNCALQENILLQGHMYLFIHHICFYSNIFGFETKKIIHFREVTCIRKAKTAAIFPNAIEIVVGGRKHLFGSFLSRDEAYRLIVEAWTQQNNDINDFQENQPIISLLQDVKFDASNPDSIVLISKESKVLGDGSSLPVRSKVENTLEEPKVSPDSEDVSDVIIKHTEVEGNDNRENSNYASPRNLPSWTAEDHIAPKVPDYFTLVVESTFPVHVEDFFRLFISDQSIGFLEDFHSRCGDKDLQCSPWQPHEQFGHVRDVSFLHPVKLFFGAKFGNCREVQKFHVYRDCHLMIETSQKVSDMPFADCFQVEGIWDVVQDKNGECSCTLRVYSNVAFSKRTIFKGKIVQSTKEEVLEVYALWSSVAHELLKQRRVGQPKVGEVKEIVLADGVVDQDNPKICEGSVGSSLPTCSPVENQKNIHSSRNCMPELKHTGQDTYGCLANFTSMLRSSWTEFLSSTKAQSQPALLLVLAFFSIIFLMQVCIIMLLSRSPEVHIVPNGGHPRDSNAHGMESIEWLQKHLNHLKEEMGMIQTRMEKMHQEYTFLKSYLQKFEEMNAKS